MATFLLPKPTQGISFCHVIIYLLRYSKTTFVGRFKYFLYQDFNCLPSFYALVMTLFEDVMLYALVNFNYFML